MERSSDVFHHWAVSESFSKTHFSLRFSLRNDQFLTTSQMSKQTIMTSTNLHDPDKIVEQLCNDALRHEHTSDRMSERLTLLGQAVDQPSETGASDLTGSGQPESAARTPDLVKPNSFLELTERPERAQRNWPDAAKGLSVSSSKQSVDVVGSSQPDEFASTSANQDQQHVQNQQTRAAEEWHAVQRSKFYKQFNRCI